MSEPATGSEETGGPDRPRGPGVTIPLTLPVTLPESERERRLKGEG